MWGPTSSYNQSLSNKYVWIAPAKRTQNQANTKACFYYFIPGEAIEKNEG